MVYIFLANGFEEIEALYTVDVLRRAGVDIKTVGGSHNIPVVCDVYKDEIDINDDFDMIILPGGLPGSTNLDSDETVDSFIKVASEKNKFICAICAAPFILGKRGLLKGKHATCYPGFEKELIGASIPIDCDVVVEKNIITARAMGSADIFAFSILEALKSKEDAESIKKAILKR